MIKKFMKKYAVRQFLKGNRMSFFDSVDEALYKAKKAGKNRSRNYGMINIKNHNLGQKPYCDFSFFIIFLNEERFMKADYPLFYMVYHFQLP
ncbi:MAG: hypothetical protein ACOCZT_03370 [Halanaerobiales bacterium]